MKFRDLRRKLVFYPGLFLFLSVAAYGLQILNLGFYWDDWQAVFLAQFKDASIFWEYFVYDRPVSAWTYIVFMPLLKTYPLGWQIFTLLLRWGSVVCIFYTFRKIWKAHERQIGWICVFVMIFPGFLLQPISVAFNQHFLTYFLFWLSMLLMVFAVQHEDRRAIFWVVSILLSFLQLLTMEYFAMLELIRPVLLFFALQHKHKEDKAVISWQTICRMTKLWFPYLVGFVFFLWWRFQYYPTMFAQYLPEEGLPNPPLLLSTGSVFQALLKLTSNAMQDILHLLFFVWTNTIAPTSINLSSKSYLFSMGVGFLCAAIFSVLVFDGKSQVVEKNPKRFWLNMLLLGGMIVFLGGLPFWVTDRQIIAGKWSERFTLAPLLGSAILLVIAISWLIRTEKQKSFILFVVLGLSLSSQMYNLNKYRLDWEIQRDFYWQLFWRVPALKEGTAVFSDGVPSGKVAAYQTAFAFNTIYQDKLESSQLPYWFFSPKDAGTNFHRLEPGHGIWYRFRNISFRGATQDAIAYTYHPAVGCLRVMDPLYRYDPQMTDIQKSLIQVNNLDRIQVVPAVEMKTSIFGKEPAHTWCYFYEKADLARQTHSWEEVIDLYAEAAQNNYSPKSVGEFLPLLQAQAALGQLEEARIVTLQAVQLASGAEAMMCDVWRSFALPDENLILNAVWDDLRCNEVLILVEP